MKWTRYVPVNIQVIYYLIPKAHQDTFARAFHSAQTMERFCASFYKPSMTNVVSMILEIVVILALMVIDYPWTVAPASVWGLSIGVGAVGLLLLYILATLIGGLVFYPVMKGRAKEFRTWKVVEKYKERGTFFSVFVANMLAHNFDTFAAVAGHGLNIVTSTLAVIVSNAIYFLTVWGLIVLVSLFARGFVLQIIVSTIVISAVWTLAARFTLHELGFGW